MLGSPEGVWLAKAASAFPVDERSIISWPSVLLSRIYVFSSFGGLAPSLLKDVSSRNIQKQMWSSLVASVWHPEREGARFNVNRCGDVQEKPRMAAKGRMTEGLAWPLQRVWLLLTGAWPICHGPCSPLPAWLACGDPCLIAESLRACAPSERSHSRRAGERPTLLCPRVKLENQRNKVMWCPQPLVSGIFARM